MRRLLFPLLLALGACAASPPPPDWALNAQGASERALAAYLAGNTRVADLEFRRLRAELARTGQPERLARAELLRCAAQVASLAFDDCPAYGALAADAAPAEQAYARYLTARAQAGDLDRLPEAQRAVARAAAPEAALAAVQDPMARLVAAGVLLRAGRASPVVVGLAVDTASAQGWSRPLLAWLGVQARLAEQAGDADGAARARRRAALVSP